MKAILLCAGFATRLYPLTKDQPKPLLPVGGRPLLDRILDALERVAQVDKVYVVSNGRFAPNFEEWRSKKKYSREIRVVNDRTMTNETRLGAIRDLKFALDQEGIVDDILVVAGDNLFQLALTDFVEKALAHRNVALAVVDVGSKELATQYGILEVGADNKVTRFLEKPKEPPSTLASMGLYFFPKEKCGLVAEYLSGRENADAPGFFIQWLLEKEIIRAFPYQGAWFDIGDLASYENANRACLVKPGFFAEANSIKGNSGGEP